MYIYFIFRFNDVQTSQTNERTEAISSTEPSIEISTEDCTDNTLNITDLLSITESTVADITKVRILYLLRKAKFYECVHSFLCNLLTFLMNTKHV